ncbi:hypothetical protein [Maribacter ulvicola]|uniref:Uncharacterized protein n=1 Tax=Maribacter ulvicola TaxID=228959 RepID=A0A1N6R1Y3_9FLAO|nr:hypothetical protein [Maribacter ulvicola]SIQ22861.1 hypothetical protein SAMN05421797_1011108 [Maribacter ulvicola]
MFIYILLFAVEILILVSCSIDKDDVQDGAEIKSYAIIGTWNATELE